MIHKEGRKIKVNEAITLKKKNLLSLLKPGDAFMFQEGEEAKYFFVERVIVQDGKVEGKYLDRSGRLNKVAISFDEIISRNPRVAYFQEILAAQ